MTTLWLDAHLSPALAVWLTDSFDVQAFALRNLGLRDAEDLEIFNSAKAQSAILITKDSDFVDLVERLGPPPQIIWLTCGNTSNQRLKISFSIALTDVISLLNSGERLVEIGGG